MLTNELQHSCLHSIAVTSSVFDLHARLGLALSCRAATAVQPQVYMHVLLA